MNSLAVTSCVGTASQNIFTIMYLWPYTVLVEVLLLILHCYCYCCYMRFYWYKTALTTSRTHPTQYILRDNQMNATILYCSVVNWIRRVYQSLISCCQATNLDLGGTNIRSTINLWRVCVLLVCITPVGLRVPVLISFTFVLLVSLWRGQFFASEEWWYVRILFLLSHFLFLFLCQNVISLVIDLPQ